VHVAGGSRVAHHSSAPTPHAPRALAEARRRLYARAVSAQPSARAPHSFDFICLLATLLACAGLGCSSKYLVSKPPADPFDAVVVPGCPSEDDGSPSRCQMGRAGHAALLWRDGWTRNFIVSGSDVHTPYVEAEAIAQAMTLLGVPPERIVLERDALHSDENVYYSILLAKKRGFARIAIASNGAIASLLCKMMVQWGYPCAAIGMDTDALEHFLPPREASLRALRAPRVVNWEHLSDREARIAKVNGYGRPPSYLLYPFYGWLGPSHRPIAPAHPDSITWAERLEELSNQ
jgi:hypothetical protein